MSGTSVKLNLVVLPLNRLSLNWFSKREHCYGLLKESSPCQIMYAFYNFANSIQTTLIDQIFDFLRWLSMLFHIYFSTDNYIFYHLIYTLYLVLHTLYLMTLGLLFMLLLINMLQYSSLTCCFFIYYNF
jgi:hypothetical protein